MKNRIKKLLISNYTLSNFYGGFGNNLQQIALGLMYSNLNGYNFYSKEHEKTIHWKNNSFNIDWPVKNDKVLLSQKDDV